MSKGNRVRVDHIYDAYEIYQATYGRSPQYKLAEARGIRHMIADWVAHTGRTGDVALMELFAGRSEHAQAIRSQTYPGIQIASYATLDRVDHTEQALASPGVDSFVCADALNIQGTVFDCVIANFFSISSVTDAQGRHNVLDQLFQSVYTSLRPGGAFMFNFAHNGYVSAICAVSPPDTEDAPSIFTVQADSPVRQKYGLPMHGKCEIHAVIRYEYNRLTGVNSDFFEGPIKVMYEDRCVAEVYVEQPMTQRYYSEIEIIEAARRAGFSDFLLYNFDYEENTYEAQPHILEREEDDPDPQDVTDEVVNCITAIK